MDFPREHWRKIRTNNGLERIMKEIRRRTRVVGSFPAGFPAMMLVGARLRHISTTKWGTRQSRLQNLRNGCIIRKLHNFYNQSKRNVRKIPDTTTAIAEEMQKESQKSISPPNNWGAGTYAAQQERAVDIFSK